MKHSKNSLVIEVQDYVSAYFTKYKNPTLIFHQIGHTMEVVEAVMEIGNYTNLSAQEIEAVSIAAWFHDIGYCHSYQEHEMLSEEIATAFMREKQLSSFQINVVLGCIRVTRLPQKPVSLLQKVMCDADFFHFSRKDYLAHADALRAEWELNLNLFCSEIKWKSINCTLLKRHKYFTSYGKEFLQARKENNIQLLEQKILE